jgi:DHA3 family multidrug efflux protein-like MFS transporter
MSKEDVTMAAEGPRLDLRQPAQRTFLHLLLNTLTVSVMNFTVWFAVTFWVYLETQSVFATGMIAGIFLIAIAATGIWFGSLVDHHHKKRVMQASAATSFVIYAASLALYVATPDASFRDPANLVLWVFIVMVMLGVIAGNLFTIALPTCVTLLIPENVRDRANGLVGTATGVSFLVTSVISGVLVAAGGMLYVLILAVGVLALVEVYLALLTVPERRIVTTAEAMGEPADGAPADAMPSDGAGEAADADSMGKGVDIRGTLRIVLGVPGLLALILFSCFNNFLGGAFMALMDAYGLSMVSVQAWGLLWGALSVGIIVGGLLVARVGLGSNPVRVLLLVNVVMWSVTILFPVRSSIVLLTVGMAIYMLIIPFAEAAEQTVLQQVVPYERQGRVFGFAQSVEQAASPLTAFLIGPITQFAVIPFMTDGWGAQTIGSWFGTGPDRGIALVFVIIGVIGLVATLLALGSRYYRDLSATVRRSSDEPSGTAGYAQVLPG